MSIIYDALKKAQKTIDIDSKIEVEVKEKNAPAKPRYKLFLIYVLVVFFGLFIGNLIFGFLANTKKSAVEQEKLIKEPTPEAVKPVTVAEVSPAQTIAPITPEVKQEPQPSFTLNGIFFSGDEGYALINNQIVKAGDTIGEAVVRKISLDEVELDSEGKIIKLSTKAR